MKNRYKILSTLFILVTSLLISSYLYLPTYFQSLDNRVRDFYFKFRGDEKASDDIVIIDIDEKSLSTLGQWPWERDKIAQILTNLSNGGAGIIGLDIVFAESDKTSPKVFAKKWDIKKENLPDYDEILAQTISTTPTILGYMFDFSVKNSKNTPQIPAIFIEKNKTKDFLPQALGVLPNIDIIQNSAYSSGYMNNIPDESGMIRSIPLLIEYNNMIFPSLAFEMYRIATQANKVTINYNGSGVEDIKLKSQHIKSDRYGRVFVNFRGEFRSYKYISAVDIYNGDFNQDDIYGKFILIGTSAHGLMDMRATPMDSVIAGVELHANMIDNLLNDDMLSKPYWAEIADISIMILISFVVILIFSLFSLSWIILSFILSVSSILYINYYLLFTQLIILNSIFPIFSLLISFMAVLGVKYIFEIKLNDIIKDSFAKKVSKQVMDELLKDPEHDILSAKVVETTIYFSDIRNFTTISENLKSPSKVMEFLNFYMDAMVQVIEKNHGTIDKFIGDAVMAYWNAPIKVENHADKAILTALKQVLMRDKLNKTIKKRYGFAIDYGIGINTGDVLTGEMGSKGRSDYTIIGDAVNLASRLEGLCKPYKVRLIISEFTKIQLKYNYVLQLLDIVQVKGKNEPVKIYEVISKGNPNRKKRKELESYNNAHNLYMDGSFTKAKEQFEILYNKYGKYLYKLYQERSIKLESENIENFDGVYRFTTK